ncbi:hypothetical protein B0H17DRAFT_1204529 [Mycena rosella]|uniref:Uncharacterized protein n=1 Tax=Mycena rosella TaxID=1033263 RepID=A0AAD7D955_MYCRO|nr:hypothetical protein B0H17DRAFT_1204529 [Mycena rosella]
MSVSDSIARPKRGFAPREADFEVSIPHVAYAALDGLVVHKLYIGKACWAFLFGIVIARMARISLTPTGGARLVCALLLCGRFTLTHSVAFPLSLFICFRRSMAPTPYSTDSFTTFNDLCHGRSLAYRRRLCPAEETANTITLELTRVVLAIGVFAIGVELPKAYMRRHRKSLFFLLAPGAGHDMGMVRLRRIHLRPHPGAPPDYRAPYKAGRGGAFPFSSVFRNMVEVEVIRNVDGESVSSAYRGPEAFVRGLMEKLRGVPRAMELDLEALGRGIEERLAGEHHHHHTHGHAPTASTSAAADDDDEGSASPSRPRRGWARRGTCRARARAGARGSLGMRSSSCATTGRVVVLVCRSVARPVDLRAADAARGDGLCVCARERRAAGAALADGYLRMQHSVRGSREASQARSVRFAEGRGGGRGGSGASTPLVGVFGEELHASPGPMGLGDGAEESPGAKVTFDLPDLPGDADPSPSGSGSGSGGGGGGGGTGVGAGVGKGYG